MVNDRMPSYPEEDEYRTEIATSEVEEESDNPAADSSPWLKLGLVLLAIFAAILAYAVVLPALP